MINSEENLKKWYRISSFFLSDRPGSRDWHEEKPYWIGSSRGEIKTILNQIVSKGGCNFYCIGSDRIGGG